MRRRLGYALVWRFVLAATVPVVILGFAARAYLGELIADGVKSDNELLARAIAEEASAHLQKPLAVLESVARLVASDTVERDVVTALLGNVTDVDGSFESVYLLDANGHVESVAFARPRRDAADDFLGNDFSSMPSWKRARASGKLVWSDAFHSIVDGRLTMSLAVPAGDHMLIGAFAIEYLGHVTDKSHSWHGVTASVIDHNGAVLFAADAQSAAQRVNLRHLSPVRRGLDGEVGTTLYTSGGQQHLGSVALMEETGWLVFVSRSLDDAFAPVRRVDTYVLFGILLAVLVAVLWALAMASRLTRPLTQLGDQAKAITARNYDVQVPPQPHEELEELAATLRIMGSAIAVREELLDKARQTLEHVARATGGATGVGFFGALAKTLNEVIGSRYSVVLEHQHDAPACVRVLAVAQGQRLLPADALAIDPRLFSELRQGVLATHQIITRPPSADGDPAPERPYTVVGMALGDDEVLGYLLVLDDDGAGPDTQSASGDAVGLDDRFTLDEREQSLFAILAGRTLAEIVRLRSERALRVSEAQYRTTFENAGVGICHLDAKRRFVWVNDHFAKMFGQDDAGLLSGQSLDDVIVDDDADTRMGGSRDDAFQSLRRGEVSHLTSQDRYRRADGTSLWGNISVSMLNRHGEGAARFVAVLEDITESKAAAATRQQLESRLQHAQRMEAIGNLAGGIAHDFNNLIAAIMGHAELLEMDLDPTTDSADSARQILKSTQRAADLTRQLLAFGRRGKLERTRLDMHLLMRDVVALLSRSTAPNIAIVDELRATRSWVEGDPTQLQNALLNLAVNARDAMPNGGALRMRTADLTVDEPDAGRVLAPGQYLSIVVQDEGAGIPLDIQDKIFQPFFTTKPTGKGTGLGLASVYGCADSHGGLVRVHSVVGHGATFELVLPVLPAPFDHADAPPTHGAARGSGHVVVIDDEEAVREYVRRALVSLGYRVTTFGSGRVAAQAFAMLHKDVDVVVLDLIMPEQSGAETFAQLRTLAPQLPVVLISGFADEAVAQALLSQPCVELVLKPFSTSELAHAVKGFAAHTVPA